jgi:hypothetical protein
MSYENAVKFISNRLKDEPDLKLRKLVEEAAFKFNLNPAETDRLYKLYEDEQNR